MIKGLIFALICVLVWGVSFVNTKALLVDFSSLEIQVLRFAMAWVVLAVVEYLLKIQPPADRDERKDRWLFAGLGFWGVALYQMLENCAIHYTNASNVSILVAINPVVTALLAWTFGFVSRPRWLFFVGFVVAISGVVMVSLDGLAEFHFSPIGDFMALGAMLSWGFYSILVEKSKRYSQVYVMRRAFGWSLVMMLPLLVFGLTSTGRTVMDGSLAVTIDGGANLARFSKLWNYVNLGALGVLASAGCFVFWNMACARLGLIRCTLGIYVIPAVTVVFAFAFLGERMTLISACGAVLTLVGVLLSSGPFKKEN